MEVKTYEGEIDELDFSEKGLSYLKQKTSSLCDGGIPLRFVITKIDSNRYHVEIEALSGGDNTLEVPSIFNFRKRLFENTANFNVVMLVPTGVDCLVGGHAGDATACARLLSTCCDDLILHPNIVNASDINEMPQNSLYVEGSVITRLLMGTVRLRKVRKNRILFITEPRSDGSWVINQVVNTASAARATIGADVEVSVLDKPISMRMAISVSGRAVGVISGIETLLEHLTKERMKYDAIALSSKIAPSGNISQLLKSYFQGEGPNPWGGVEAALTHTLSSILNIPTAHAPTLEDLALRTENYGKTDPRKAAEAISTSFSFCLLKGLHKSPKIEILDSFSYEPACLTVEDISCLVIPDNCIGLPVLAAIKQGVNVIAIKGNKSLMKGELSKLEGGGNIMYAENYLEAAGLLLALREGISPKTILRPMGATVVK